MPAVCLYFQVHQPYRLRRYSVFDDDPFYFDNERNQTILERIAEKCYRPALTKLVELVRRHDGQFRLAFGLTSTAVEQLRDWAPDVIELFQELAATGACEFLAETSHHSLAFLFSRAEFEAQVKRHEAMLAELFGVRPAVFRNTELIYSNELAVYLAGLGKYRGVLCEGVPGLKGFTTPDVVCRPPGSLDLGLLLKNFRLSDDVAFRFTDQGWENWPLTAEQFAKWVGRINGQGSVCNLFMDFETFGEHHWEETGIFGFLDELPDRILEVNPGANEFKTPSECLAAFEPVGEYDVPRFISWADTERDLSAWLGNDMQKHAAAEVYELEAAVKKRHNAGDEYILEDWRKLTSSDHLYYMCIKYWSDGDVHRYFSPYDSPYDSYINFMNVLENVRKRCEARPNPPGTTKSVPRIDA